MEALEDKPVIDYEFLKWLVSIDGLRSKENDETTPEAHDLFMKNYHRMFAKKKNSSLPALKGSAGDLVAIGASTANDTKQPTGTRTSTWQQRKAIKEQQVVEEMSHDIREHNAKLHKQRKSENPEAKKSDNIKTLRRLLRKLPFERNASENDQIFRILQTFPLITAQVPDAVLKELCVVAQLDVWKEPQFTVFGHSGLHIILRGSVKPFGWPFLHFKEDPTDFLQEQQDDNFPDQSLGVGDCFGTLVKLEGVEPNSKLLSVETIENNCEFLKISTSDYHRITEQMKTRDQTEKLNLLLSIPAYRLWPRQPLTRVADSIRWVSYQQNTVLVSEGYQAPFIGFIKQGTCHVLRQVEVMVTLANGKQEKKQKQVVMGKMKESESFGEISIMQEEPFTCSIVTATPVEIAVIDQERVKELDDVTKKLLVQRNERNFGNLTTENIHEEYVRQEMKREWNEYKHNVVVDVINSKGIRPGYGKWSK